MFHCMKLNFVDSVTAFDFDFQDLSFIANFGYMCFFFSFSMFCIALLFRKEVATV